MAIILPCHGRDTGSTPVIRSMYDLIIIGSGAAGLSAGIYAGRYRLKTLIVSKNLGGETTTAGKISITRAFWKLTVMN